jgi:uncharacterized protein (TIGR03067 family)
MLIVALLLTLVGQAPAAALAPLQGRWVVTGAEHGAKPFDAITGGVMTVTGERFEIRTAAGTLLQGSLRLETSTVPYRMDLLHADGARWEAIYEVSADTFRLNYVDAELKERRPEMFVTSESTEATIVMLRRENR